MTAGGIGASFVFFIAYIVFLQYPFRSASTAYILNIKAHYTPFTFQSNAYVRTWNQRTLHILVCQKLCETRHWNMYACICTYICVRECINEWVMEVQGSAVANICTVVKNKSTEIATVAYLQASECQPSEMSMCLTVEICM